MTSERLGNVLVGRFKIPTRSRAADVIKRGYVKVNGKVALKPGQTVSQSDEVFINTTDIHYVSRGALKLKAALSHFQYPITDKIVLDIGASTGGFIQVLCEAEE